VIRKLSTLIILLLLLSVISVPVVAIGGNGGSSGSDGAGSGGSGGGGNGGDSAGNAGGGAGTTTGQDGPQAQPLQEEQERKQQETIEQPGVQINQQDRDQAQGRTGVDATAETADVVRERDRDLFLQDISIYEQNLSQAQDRQKAQVDVALYSLSNAGNVSGGAGQQLTRLAGEINNTLADAYQAEQQIEIRSSFTRMIFGGDQEAAGLLIQYADQNKQQIQLMEQLVTNCSDCDPQVKTKLEEQVQVLQQEQNRLTTLGQQEQADRGLFGWLFGSSTTPAGIAQVSALTDDEKYWMTYMREEEKLARDVYLSLGSKWNLQIFYNIAQSEQTHMDSVKTLLDRYGIPDPAEGKAQGEFTNPDLQKLHDDLVARGSISQQEALQVGVLIEETDIEDLNKAISSTQKNDIKTVYNNLLQGSLNHLNAFETDLARY
jgi:hypothetical protein